MSDEDLDLPDFIPIEIYEETFGDFKNVTEKWYKKNEPDKWSKYQEWCKKINL